jgi:hypothetical protein
VLVGTAFFVWLRTGSKLKLKRLMRFFALTFILVIIQVDLAAQFRFNKLIVKQGETFNLGASDIMVADTLMMMDSSRIILNNLKRENFIRVKVAMIGKSCWVIGRGVSGKNGYNGKMGKTLMGPCRSGLPGTDGGRGLDGNPGMNLFFYIDQVIVNGNLVIDLSGGNAGDGGEGGEGGGGTTGTLHCNGGTGGVGGNGGNGGYGGTGGTLTLGGLDAEELRSMISARTIIVNLLGGNLGYGGLKGQGGAPGLGPTKKTNGTKGKDGNEGTDGIHGNNGSIQYEQQ